MILNLDNKPSSTLSSELVYNAELVYNFSSAALFSGIGGISSLKNDPYSSSPINKPIISTGNDRLFNSINREKQYLYAGVQYAFGDFIVGLKGETILSGVSTDKGNTISLNIRWEKLVQPPLVKSVVEKVGMVQDYFADGFVERLSTSKKLIKVNVGSDKNIKVGDSADIYSVDDYGLRMPIATGSVIEVNENACFVRIVKRFKNSTIDVGRLVRFY
jgi:hypothetical protein